MPRVVGLVSWRALLWFHRSCVHLPRGGKAEGIEPPLAPPGLS